jgi:hypothetical protein
MKKLQKKCQFLRIDKMSVKNHLESVENQGCKAC